MRIQHNILAMNAYRNYTNNTSALGKNLEKLSSGYKINRAGDDAAGLAISEKMRAQITGLQAAQKNVKDGVSLVKTAEGALAEIHDMLNRMDYLATQSANGTYDNEVDRYQLQKEVDALRTEINRIADSANFNGIKLFDGSLSGADITSSGIATSQVDMAKGVDVTMANGGGTYGTFTINLDSALTDGDVLEIDIGGLIAQSTGNGGLTTAGSTKLTLTYNGGADSAADGEAKIEVGNSVADQAYNIEKALKRIGVGGYFEITHDGNSVTLTARVEGNNTTELNKLEEPMTSTVIGVKFSDTNGNLKAKQDTQDATSAGWGITAGKADTTAGRTAFKNLVSTQDGKGVEIKDNDVITFELTLASGKVLTVTAVAGKDFDVSNEDGKTYDNLINFLNTNAYFVDNEDTVIDESKIKFSDVFTAAKESNDTDKGTTFTIAQKATSTFGSLVGTTAANGKFTLDRVGSSQISKTGEAGTGTNSTLVAGSAGTAAKYGILLDSTDADSAANLTIGDKLEIKGKLSDGREFTLELEAGKDFIVGEDYDTTLANLKKLLESDNLEVTLYDGSDTEVVKGSDIFGADKEITVDAGSSGADFFTSNDIGTGASQISSVKLINGDDSAISSKLRNGEGRSAAESSITFSDGVEYGAVIEVGGKKYELVKSAGDLSNSNHKAVIVDDITDVADVAAKLRDALKGDLNEGVYSVTASNNKVTVSTVKIGSAAEAIDASALGDKTGVVEFTLDPKKMQYGTTVSINGQTYEFVKPGENASKKEYTALYVSDFNKETASTLGAALAKAANGQNNAAVTVDENGKVTVRGLVDSDTNEIVKPNVKFDGGTSGLTLQIGDTADSFNQMKVSIYNMHTADMGIADINIAEQESAASAIDSIKAAINYVSDVRGTLGATQNRLEHTQNNLSVMAENIQDAESTIRDTDVADEMMAYTKNNILIQSAQAMLAQANQVPQGVLQLLQ